jgi:UDP-glucose 4-epimerase
MRVLVTGMGGELGTRVAQLLETRREVDEIVGCDFVPPRRRLRRAEFRRIDPHHRERLRDFVTEFAPTHIAHFGVYEPASRTSPHQAARRTELTTMVALSAAARAGALQYVVVRSGLEIYGRSGRATVPDESVPPAPTSPFGMSLLQVEAVAAGLRHRHGIKVGALRYAPVVGSHVPSPLGRLLRLPVVPVDALSDPPFSLLHPEDACNAMVAALTQEVDGPLNIVGPGATSPWQAARLGGRIPVPVLAPFWSIAPPVVEFLGAAIAPHVVELLRHGCVGAGGRALEELDIERPRPTQRVLQELFDWAEIVPISGARETAA